MAFRGISAFILLVSLLGMIVGACSSKLYPVAPSASTLPGSIAPTNSPTSTPTGSYKMYITFTPTLTPTGTITPVIVTTFAGSGVYIEADGTGTGASFQLPTGLAIDQAGNLYVGDDCGRRIRKITPGAIVTTLAGGSPGSADGTGTAASFNSPVGLAVDSAGNIYAADDGNDLIRKITPSGVVSTLAGSAGVTGLVNGAADTALFNSPMGVAFDASGNLYVADSGNNLIRKIAPSGMVSTLAGGGGGGYMGSGSGDGAGTLASFWCPVGIVLDPAGNLFVADQQNNLIRKVTPGGVVTTLAGGGGLGYMGSGYADGKGSSAAFSLPTGLALDPGGNLYVGDSGNSLIREISPGGVVSTLAGSLTLGAVNGPASIASFHMPEGVVLGGSGVLYVADQQNEMIRKIAF
jgi:sugar lactone lactonase YvrE